MLDKTMQRTLLAAALLSGFASITLAQQVTLYGRVDLSVAQQADAVKNTEIRNGSGSRLGVRGTEDLGGGLKAVFHLEHRFSADTGTAGTRFWDGKSIVGLSGGFGTVTLGRDENPAYTYAQKPGDPWGGDTVASNGSIINGRIGSTRYSNAVNYHVKAGAIQFGAQMTEGDGLDARPYSLGLNYSTGGLELGLGFENPGNDEDKWLTLLAGYDFGSFGLTGQIGNGTNANGQTHRAWLLGATTKLGAGELRASYGQLKNTDLDVVADKQFAIGYHYKLSKRTTVYTDLVNEGRDKLPGDRKSTGWDVGIKHNF
jgi:predicted porin